MCLPRPLITSVGLAFEFRAFETYARFGGFQIEYVEWREHESGNEGGTRSRSRKCVPGESSDLLTRLLIPLEVVRPSWDSTSCLLGPPRRDQRQGGCRVKLNARVCGLPALHPHAAIAV